jgi:hypothetical protein
MPEKGNETAAEIDASVVPQVEIRRFRPGDEADFKRLNEEWIVRHFAL